MNKIKHLEFLQSIINRMGSHSFLIKGWSVTLAVAILAFTAKSGNTDYVFSLLFFIPLMWILDGFYLSQERHFRKVYNQVRLKDENDIDFALQPQETGTKLVTWFGSLFSFPMLIFYSLLAGLSILINYLSL